MITAKRHTYCKILVNLRLLSSFSNCQIGLGRSTLGTVVVSLIISWLSGKKWNVPPGYREPAIHYQIIHSLLRVIRNGLESKRIVDLTIDLCSVHLNLRDCIEDFRLIAENEPDVEKASQDIRRGVQCLKRYFLIITFQAYLDQFTPDCLDEMESFESWFVLYSLSLIKVGF